MATTPTASGGPGVHEQLLLGRQTEWFAVGGGAVDTEDAGDSSNVVPRIGIREDEKQPWPEQLGHRGRCLDAGKGRLGLLGGKDDQVLSGCFHHRCLPVLRGAPSLRIRGVRAGRHRHQDYDRQHRQDDGGLAHRVPTHGAVANPAPASVCGNGSTSAPSTSVFQSSFPVFAVLCTMSAANPATCGVAMDVPLIVL